MSIVRNYRGLLPKEMTHQIGKEEEAEPDYVFVAKDDRSDMLLKQIERVNIAYRSYTSKKILSIPKIYRRLKLSKQDYCSIFPRRIT